MDLNQRLNDVEQRLDQIEVMIGLGKQSSRKPTPLSPPTGDGVAAKEKSLGNPEASPGNMLGIFGIICFVLAAIYIVRLAVDSGWLTPARQLALSAMLGMILIFAGFFFKERDEEYVSYLPAGGIIVLFLTIFGATNYHHLLPSEAGIVASLVVAAACLCIYRYFKHSIYQIIAIVGAYVGPLFMSATQDLMFTNIFYVISSLTFSTMAVWLDERAITLVSAYLSIAVVSLTGNGFQESKAIFVFIHFVIYTVGVFFHTAYHRRALTVTESKGFFPLIIFFYAIEYYHINHLFPNYAPYFSLALSGLLISIYFSARNLLESSIALASGDALISSSVLILIHSLYFVLLPDEYRPAGFLIFAFLALVTHSRFPKEWEIFGVVGKMALIGLFGWSYFNIFIGQIASYEKLWIIYGAVYAISLFAAYLALKKSEREPFELVLLAAHGISILSLYNLSKDYGSLSVSIAWLIYALLVLGIGYRIRDDKFAKSSVIILIVAAGKALLWDVAHANPIIRVLCLLITGGLLYYSGLILRRIESWKKIS